MSKLKDFKSFLQAEGNSTMDFPAQSPSTFKQDCYYQQSQYDR